MDEVDPPVAPLGALHVQAVDEHDEEQPGDQRGVLHRVPAPVAAPAEGLVGPVAAHQDGAAEHQEAGQRPGKARAAQPSKSRRHSAAIAKAKGTADQRVADEHDRRVDHHPVVLEQRVEPGAVGRRLRQHDEGVLAHQDEQQAEEGEGVDPHHRRLDRLPAERASGRPMSVPQKQPDQEAPLLAGPEGGDLEVAGEVEAGVLGDVLDAEVAAQQGQTTSTAAVRTIDRA